MASSSETVRKKPNQSLIIALALLLSLAASSAAQAAAATAAAPRQAAAPTPTAKAAPSAAAPAPAPSPAPNTAKAPATPLLQANARGSTAGLLSPAPQWSAGAQIGNYGGTGLSAQRLGLPGGGALNLNLGIEGGALGVSGDYVWFVSDQFHMVQLRPNSDYNATRSQLMMYYGGGAGWQNGAWLRVPVGVQYTMLRDPFSFYGGFALAFGPFMSDGRPGMQAWLSIGMRFLL